MELASLRLSVQGDAAVENVSWMLRSGRVSRNRHGFYHSKLSHSCCRRIASFLSPRCSASSPLKKLTSQTCPFLKLASGSSAGVVHKGRFVTQLDRLRVIGDDAVVVFFGFVG